MAVFSAVLSETLHAVPSLFHVETQRHEQRWGSAVDAVYPGLHHVSRVTLHVWPDWSRACVRVCRCGDCGARTLRRSDQCRLWWPKRTVCDHCHGTRYRFVSRISRAVHLPAEPGGSVSYRHADTVGHSSRFRRHVFR